MKVAIGSDHRGIEFRKAVEGELKRLGLDVLDMGTDTTESVDYPDYAKKVTNAVTTGEAERGIAICGTGLGVCMAANKVAGIRAALAHDVFTAERSRLHNDANVLCLGAEVVLPRDLPAILEVWFATDFEGGRHQRRVDKINRMASGD